MTALRDEIRAILREELAAVLAGHSGVTVQTVRVDTSDDLNAFARTLAEQLTQPGFAEKLTNGTVRFALERPAAPTPSAVPMMTTTQSAPAGRATPMLDKKLITESDLAQFGPGLLRIPKQARLTPLANDEARRKGVRIERIET